MNRDVLGTEYLREFIISAEEQLSVYELVIRIDTLSGAGDE